MTERRSERWLVTSGAASRPVRTRHADDTTLEVTVGGGAEARTLTATIVACSEDACVVSIAGAVDDRAIRAARARRPRRGRPASRSP